MARPIWRACRTSIRLAACSAALAVPAVAQRVTDNAATNAEDAFGTSIGNERVGLYSGSDVRGFSPATANNIRLEGLYIDRPAAFTDRLVQGNVVRVGLTAQNYLFPAPTGIVDYRIRPAGNDFVLSTMLGLNSWGGGRLELDAQLPVIKDRLSLVAGIAGFVDELAPGNQSFYGSYALAARWKPAPGVEVIPFWSRVDLYNREAAPLYTPAGAFLPPAVRRRFFPGPEWADQRNTVQHYGILTKARLTPEWQVAAGLFRSTSDSATNYAQNFTQMQPDGTAIRRITADPQQTLGGTSGEVRISRTFADGPRRHTLHAALRGRDRASRYGGGASVLYERGSVEAVLTSPRPEFVFGPQTSERVRQAIAGIAYDGRWQGVGGLSLGLQRTWYRKRVDRPGTPLARTDDEAWLPNITASADLTDRLAFYSSFTRGLEETGLAPDSAANRTEALPAILTSQVDAGLRWKAPRGINILAGLFDVRKPYFAADEANVFRELGNVRHRGMELSAAGPIAPRLTIVAGAVLMQPRVSGPAVALGRVGPRPIGQPSRLLTLAAQYAVAGIDGFALTLNATHRGPRAADTRNLVELPARTILDAGVRWRFDLGANPALLRVQLLNLTNAYDWALVGSGSYQVNAPRQLTMFLTVDF
ncbi:TonB-dependent receptor domain-containing protein [Polymorphobacter fuscus]|uniref:TonB-dependent receptor domain-containing protein n=1 Tax=Sandarakinorhabdus fusca TaxID=1439888 RepID=UPI0016A3EB6F|nr:TonB-dependent receptor [Polymorphobacter fuscus]NJC09622.1 iron complex outermembrane receptor protein [Polymorphobacter fuscus]